MHAGPAPDNLIVLRHLDHAERLRLQQAFTHIRILQHRLGYVFPGGTQI